MSHDEAIESIVESLEACAESVGAIGDFFATLDLAIQKFPDAERLTPASFVRAYKAAAAELESDDDDEDEPGP